jgi:ribosomal protein L34E
MNILRTRTRGARFSYDKAPDGSIRIEFGRNQHVTVTAADARRLLQAFKGRTVALGTSRTNPPPGSVGEWLQQNVTKVAIASYVGPILVHEGYAVWVDDSTLRFVAAQE